MTPAINVYMNRNLFMLARRVDTRDSVRGSLKTPGEKHALHEAPGQPYPC